MTEKNNEIVAQFKYTIAVRDGGPYIICGDFIDLSRYQSEYQITNDEINKLLEIPLDNFLPSSKKSVKVEKKKDNKLKQQKKKEAKLRKKEEKKKEKEKENNK